MDAFKVIIFILVFLALALSLFSLFQKSSVDFNQCSVKGTALKNPQSISCNQLCGSETCTIALHKKSESVGGDSNSQESLVDCSKVVPTGNIDEDELGDYESSSLNCLCCS